MADSRLERETQSIVWALACLPSPLGSQGLCRAFYQMIRVCVGVEGRWRFCMQERVREGEPIVINIDYAGSRRKGSERGRGRDFFSCSLSRSRSLAYKIHRQRYAAEALRGV